jgi:hypothetical protein
MRKLATTLATSVMSSTSTCISTSNICTSLALIRMTTVKLKLPRLLQELLGLLLGVHLRGFLVDYTSTKICYQYKSRGR